MKLQAIDPKAMPKIPCPGGGEIPAVGMGTFGSDHVSAEEIAAAVEKAVELGCRHIDCASVYGNEKEIGRALRRLFDRGIVRREELWITSKLWNDMHGPGDGLLSCAQSLKDLGLNYLDLYLVHWPFPNYHPPGCDVTSRSPDARPYIHEEFMALWRQMEQLVKRGLVRHIGNSNMSIPKIELLLRDAEIKPVCNEMELHPHFQQPEFFSYIREKGIIPIGYSPIGSPARPERDRTAADSVDIEDPVIRRIAKAHGVHPAVICIKWAVGRGQIPIPFSAKPQKILSNLKAACEDPLSSREMEEISAIDRGCRLIKGQVFLWKKDQDWRALWDEGGTITPP